MLSYRRFLELEEDLADKRIEAYTANRRKRAEDEAAAITAAYDAKQQADYAAGEAQREQLEGRYRDAYDANVVEELVQRRRAAEAIANSNLQNSGMERAHQTGIAVARERADRAVTEERQAALQKLMNQLDSLAAETAFAAEKKRIKAYTDAERDIDAYTQDAQKRMVSYAEKRFKNQGDDETEYKDGTVNAVNNDGPSLNALSIATQANKRFHGDEYAAVYLDRMLLQGRIRAEDWITLMDRYALMPVGEGNYTYQARVERLLSNSDEKQARLYIEYLQKKGLLTDAQVEELRAYMYR